MLEIKCPECGSTEFECYDSETYYGNGGEHMDHCYCEECDAQFKILYKATSIEKE